MNVREDYKYPGGWIDSPDEFDGLHASLVNMCKDIGSRLMRAYPGWRWVLQPDQPGGVITLYCSRIGTMKYGCIMRISDLQNDPSRKLAIDYAGLILERFGMPRKPFKRHFLARLRYDVLGSPIPDITDFDGKIRRSERDRTVTDAVNSGMMDIAVKDVEDQDGTTTRHLAIKPPGKEEGSNGI